MPEGSVVGELSGYLSGNLADLVPFNILRSQSIPPAPNRRSSAIDFLPDFGGAAWIAYGAASLLVISHFPSPNFSEEGVAGPFFRQVIDPPDGEDAGDDVIAVSWCPAPGIDGELAAAAGRSVRLYSVVLGDEPGTFFWRQRIGIVESFAVEAIGWTGSGDGMIAAGKEVALWKRKYDSWEVAWKSKPPVPHCLVSANCFAEGPVATAASPVEQPGEGKSENLSLSSKEECKYVIVHCWEGNYDVKDIQLSHPQPVSMIQWRPLSRAQLENDASHLLRDVLMTCCLDGTVRLWCELDDGNMRKSKKWTKNKKNMKPVFHIIAVVEMNQSLKGILGRDIFVQWAFEVGGLTFSPEGDNCRLSVTGSESSDNGKCVKCEWLISIGPSYSVAFWAIHCLDDFSPARFPRVTLWKKQNLIDFRGRGFSHSELSNSKDQPVFIKAVTSRRIPSGPPVLCSLLQLLSDNSLNWSQLYDAVPRSSVDSTCKEESLSCFACSSLTEEGHTGSIIQVAIHPYYDIELAVSLDSNGLVLLWSLSMISECALGVKPDLCPSWTLLGHIPTQDLSPKCRYSHLIWAPAILDEKCFLLMTHTSGVDCYVIDFSSRAKDIMSQKLFTIPFDNGSVVTAPDQIFTTSLSCKHDQPCQSFMLLCIWMTNFHTLSWKVVLHSKGPLGTTCGCRFSAEDIAISFEERYTSAFGRTLSATYIRQSSEFLPPFNPEHVTSAAVISLNHYAQPIDFILSSRNSETNCSGYHMATGFSDGTLKLWKLSNVESDMRFGVEGTNPWKLVGGFTAHHGTVGTISLSTFGGKIATASVSSPDNTTKLHIWQSVSLIDGGCFILEDVIELKEDIIAMNWLVVGSGQLLLGVCLPNEFRIFSQIRLSSDFGVHVENSTEMHAWSCIAFVITSTIINDFFWGPKLSAVLVHDKHISVLSQWIRTAKGSTGDNCFVHCVDILSDDGNCKKSKQQEYTPVNIKGLHSMLDVANGLDGSLPLYHPNALIQHVYSGNWKRALVVLKHFFEFMKSDLRTKVGGSKCRSFHSIPEVHLSNYFEDQSSVSSSSNETFKWGQSVVLDSTTYFHGSMIQFADSKMSSSTTSSKSEIKGFINTLEKDYATVSITEDERIHILALLDLLCEIADMNSASAYLSLDEPGRRFWVAAKLQRLYSIRKYGELRSDIGLAMNSKLAAWALQSDCQDDLLNSVLSTDPSWQEMKNLGIGLWYMNTSQLRTRMEKLARSQYLKNKNPKDCALLYLALNRLQVLASLFKVSRDEKDKLLVAFLSRNFQEDKNKAAALKNAYVLMGKHQLELAIAFFLLGGDPSSAVSVCAKNLGDEQLALVICRLLEGHGGPLERNLISSFLLPNAIRKKDWWLSSLFELMLGNHLQSIKILINPSINREGNKSAISNHCAYSDPDIGQYCLILAAKNSFRSSVGEVLASVLSKLAINLAAMALNRHGLPLEALGCLTSSLLSESKNQGKTIEHGNHEVFHVIVNPLSEDACSNWMAGELAHYFYLDAKLLMASRYLSRIVINQRIWPHTLARPGAMYNYSNCLPDFEYQIGNLKNELDQAFSVFSKKFSLEACILANMVQVLFGNGGISFLAYLVSQEGSSVEVDGAKIDLDTAARPAFSRLFCKGIEEISLFVARYIVSCNFTGSLLNLASERRIDCQRESYDHIHRNYDCLQQTIFIIGIFRELLKICRSIVGEDLITIGYVALDLLDAFVTFASTLLPKNVKGLIMIIHPTLVTFGSEHSVFGSVPGELRNCLHQISWSIVHDASTVGVRPCTTFHNGELKQSVSSIPSTLEDEKWLLLGICLCLRLLYFIKNMLTKFSESEFAENEAKTNVVIKVPALAIPNSFLNSIEFVTSSLVSQLASFLRQKALVGSLVSNIFWLVGDSHPQSKPLHISQGLDTLLSSCNDQEMFEILWGISFNPGDVYSYLTAKKVDINFNRSKIPYLWRDIQKEILSHSENSTSYGAQKKMGSTSSGNVSVQGERMLERNDGSETTKRLSDSGEDIACFQKPKEIFKRSGELFEAICVNSLNEQELAVASNKKGLIFVDMKPDSPIREQTEYVWLHSEWPVDGWAGSESTPVPTYVSQGIGLGNRKGAHLGLGGATVGFGSSAKPGRELTGGGTFGVPGYAGMGASGLGWEEEDFEELRDLPATVHNIRSRALSAHPSRPLLLVGSNNTHVYLWQFGKEKAMATYGVLPAANVPPPYALASVSALRFDHYGHRFSSAALDGTICTWQLEVGGRSNVHPTDSWLCFSHHASDVAYISASGSIVAAAGSSENGANVVAWDTLAPPDTCLASLHCHEGGARSIGVLSCDIGNSSVSPIIITGGRNGDIGLHDFRFIATGRSKRHRNASVHLSSSPVHNSNPGSKYGESSDGMIWYIPKAHSGSVTKISAIPNSSFFLTGSKDGDVKLWDAKRSKLVFHWQKLHERYTFLQANTRGYGGIVRAAVTDIQVIPNGFLTCGGDGLVKTIQLK